MKAPSYLERSTVEYCEQCRCKTRHHVDPQTGERVCEWHQNVRAHAAERRTEAAP